MSEDMDDAEFWLPSEFLADDFFMEGAEQNRGAETGVAGACMPCQFPYGFGSNLSSPVESVTETESDEEEYMVGLTQQMAHSFLHDEEKEPPVLAGENAKTKVVAGSPQSTLCAVGSWSISSRGSSNGPSQVSSPPSTPLEQHKDDPWDLLYAAAGQVVRMRLNDQVENQKFHGRGLLGPPRKPSSSISAHTKNPTTGYYANPALTHQQLQTAQFQQLKQQQLMKQQFSSAWGRQNRSRGGGNVEGRCGRPLGLSSSAWPPLQQQQQQQPQAGSGMRAVFLGGSGSRRESCGTGVFLPRRIGNSSEMRKKPACSTVLLPARVVQALNLNLEDMGAQPRFPGGFVLDHDALMARSSGALPQHRRNHLRPQPSAAPTHEIRLPAEWTY